METVSQVKENLRGKLVEYKRSKGRGRPSVGRVIDQTTRSIMVHNTQGHLEKVRLNQILRVRKRTKKAA